MKIQKYTVGKHGETEHEFYIEMPDSAAVEGKIMPPDFQIIILRQVSMCTLPVKSFLY